MICRREDNIIEEKKNGREEEKEKEKKLKKKLKKRKGKEKEDGGVKEKRIGIKKIE